MQNRHGQFEKDWWVEIELEKELCLKWNGQRGNQR